ncbi:MAG: glycosyltransferase [Rikenellaceae bacterium]|nr:glycosyltransferase [Rikenellaceae bacterium]MBQ6572427.1 glycosyltransferase [Alistipes sp.]
MKILHIITSLHTGGAEKLIIDLTPRLRELGYSIDVLLFDGSNTPFKQQLVAAGITILELGKGGSVYNPLHIFNLIPIIRQYDIIHTHNTAPQLFAAIANIFGKTKLITTEHSTDNRRRHLWWYKPIDRFMYNQYKEVICISDQAEENLRNYIGKCRANITTIYNGVDIQKYATAQPSSELNNIAPNCKKIIMVAGFRYQKDQDTLIRATTLLPQEFHTFLVGDGERREVCEKLAIAEGVSDRVHFMGIRMDVPELLKAADYIVMSSHWEGLSLASIEGMSVGKPFLASDVDGLREITTNAGVLFQHQNTSQLAEEIKVLDKNTAKYQQIAQQCFDKAKLFDISIMAENYNNVYLNA